MLSYEEVCVKKYLNMSFIMKDLIFNESYPMRSLSISTTSYALLNVYPIFRL